MRRFSLLLILLFMPSLIMAQQQPSAQQSLETVTLQLKWLHQFQFAGYIAAKEKGFYRDVGLDVTIQQRTPDINVINEVLEGGAQYGIGGMGLLAHYANGVPIKALAAIFQHDALVFISKADSGIVSPYEFANKRIMNDTSAGNDTVLRVLLDDAGITFNDITLVAQDLGIESLKNGSVDVMSAYITSQPFHLRQNGQQINIIKPQNYGFDFYGDLLFTSVREIKNHPGRSERMLQASIRGWEYALAHPDEIIQIIKNQYDHADSIEQLEYEARETRKLILPNVIPIGTIQASRLRRIANIYTQLGIAPAISDKTLSHFLHQRPASSTLTEEQQQWLDAHPVIRVGIDRDFAPYEWINEDDKYVGLAAEYIDLLEQRLGVSFEIVHDKPWHEIMAMARRGELDMLSCLNRTDSRDQHLDFTAPYVSNPIVIVNANRHGYIGSLDKLKGKTVAVERGYFTHETLKSDYPEITLLAVDDTQTALKKVAAGVADAYIGDAAYANFAIKKNDLLNLQFAGQTQLNTAYRIGVHNSNPELLGAINMVLDNVTEAERENIEEQWLGLMITNGPKLETLIKFSLAIMLLFLLFSYWIYRLRQSRQALAESEAKLRDVLNASPIPQGILDNTDRMTYLNQAFTDTYGYTLADIPTARDLWQKMFPDSQYQQQIQQKWQFQLEQLDNTNQFNAVEGEVSCKNGRKRSVIANATRVNSQTEKTTLIILYDISERKIAEERLKMSGRVFNQAHEGILITDAKGHIVDVNPAFSEITGYTHKEVIGQNPSLLQSDKHSRVFFQEMWTSLQQKGHWQGEIWNLKKNGQLFAELLTISTLVDEHGETLHYLGLFSDITQSKEQQQALELMAHYDMLTQLPNRTLFADRFNQAIAHSNRNNSLLAVVFLDLDGFKPVNDRYGHDIGDQLLIEIAQRIKASIRQDDTASRLGGDEFVLLLNDISSLTHAERLINRIRHAIELPYQIDDDTLSLSASLGITIYPLDNADADTLLRHADQAMYQAKLGGRGRHQMFDALHDQQVNQQQNQFKAMQDALKADQLVLHYQPKVNMCTGSVVGVEALIRWQHPAEGLILPGKFLPAIQGTELEIHVGNWVIEQVMQQLEIWLNHDIEMEISINISSHHLQWHGFFEQLDHILGRHPKVPSNLLQLEILESSVLSDINNISSIINTCRSVLGIRISLDDFGTGYSSLTHLRHLPVDMVKIDQSFVHDIIDDPNDYTIIDGVIGLTQAFHHQVIAEGVETVDHGLMLIAMGCEMAQGYVIAKPMPANECRQWFSDYQPNPQWLELAQKNLDAEQTIIQLMRLQGNHWLSHIIQNLRSDADKIEHWPLMNHKKSHFMHWLEQAKKQDLFNKTWRENIKVAYTELYHEANSLKYQYQEGHWDVGETGIKGLLERFQTIEDMMQQFE